MLLDTNGPQRDSCRRSAASGRFPVGKLCGELQRTTSMFKSFRILEFYCTPFKVTSVALVSHITNL